MWVSDATLLSIFTPIALGRGLVREFTTFGAVCALVIHPLFEMVWRIIGPVVVNPFAARPPLCCVLTVGLEQGSAAFTKANPSREISCAESGLCKGVLFGIADGDVIVSNRRVTNYGPSSIGVYYSFMGGYMSRMTR